MTREDLRLAHQQRPLGCIKSAPDARDLKLATYLDTATLINSGKVPAAHAWQSQINPDGVRPEPDTDPLGNDRAGNCVYAAPGHMVQLVGQQTSAPLVVTATDAISAYAEDTGYDPVTGANDNGAQIRSMLKRWKARGLYGTQLLGFAAVDWRNPIEVAIASYLGCGLIGGYALPLASQGQTDQQGRQLWDKPPTGWPNGQGPGSWGLHCIYSSARSPGLDGGNSWGEPTYWTPAWRGDCCFELWLVLVEPWIMADGHAPNGFSREDLLSDAQARGAL